MPKSKGKKRKYSNSNELSNVCNITGLDEPQLQNDNLLDCLEELASAQVQAPDDAQTYTCNDHKGAKSSIDTTTNKQQQRPGFHRVSNLKIELSRHLQIETLSTYVLRSCKGLRMPTFERWLLDSKLEEKTRYESIISQWEEDPSIKAELVGHKKKYGRAAHFGDLAKQKEQRRLEKESRLLLNAEQYSSNRRGLIRSVEIDPILPSEPLATDPSCVRLMDELKSVLSSTEEKIDVDQVAADIVKELCSRTAKAVNNLAQLETRLGKYQKFAWDVPSGSSGNKKKKDKAASGNVDRVTVEWNDDGSVCSLIYTQKKKKSETSEKDEEGAKHKPKPFVVKLNSTHYHKLRAMFDKTYESFNAAVNNTQLSKTQIADVFNSITFAMIIRYSSLAGGQQLNDLRGGGMQGAIHNQVFDCFTKWFGSQGVECFASPFNCHLAQYYSAFSSPDIDGYFGSTGDFFLPNANEVFLRDGYWYELNPPFSPGIMDKMADRIAYLLNVASEQRKTVTFIVIVPTVNEFLVVPGEHDHGQNTTTIEKKKKKRKHTEDRHKDEPSANPVSSLVHQSASKSFNTLIQNCTAHIVLNAREHGYIEGSQHLRPTQYKESRYSTSVIVLQSEAMINDETPSRLNWDSDSFERDLKEAFACRHMMEVEMRKNC